MAINLGESYVIRQLRYFLRDRLTPSGRMVFYLTLLGNALGGISLVIKTYLVGVCLFCLLVGSAIAARLLRVRLKVDLDIPARATRNQPFMARVTVTNMTGRMARDSELRLVNIPLHCSLRAVGSRPDEIDHGLPLGDVAPEGRAQAAWEITVEREGAAKPVCIAESLSRRY